MATDTEERKLIPRIKTYVICRTYHQDEESIRYMIGIVRSTLIESLKHQTDKDFTFVWLFNEGCKFERYRAKMLKSAGIDFQFFMPSEAEVRSEIEVNQSVFLHNRFVAEVKSISVQTFLSGLNYRSVVYPNGYCHHEGKTVPLLDYDSFIRTEVFLRPSEARGYCDVDFTNLFWIYVSHPLFNTVSAVTRNAKPTKVDWQGWDPALVNRYVATRMATGTAKGSTLEPYKSKSLIRVRHPGKVPRGRRRRDDVAE
jgi:hypothetical protein